MEIVVVVFVVGAGEGSEFEAVARRAELLGHGFGRKEDGGFAIVRGKGDMQPLSYRCVAGRKS